MVTLNIDARQLRRLEKVVAHLENGLPRALTPAINRALAHGRTIVKREIRKDYLIKASDIPVKVRKATYGNLTGDLRLDQTMLPLINFKIVPKGVQHRKKKRVISAQVKRSSGAKLIAHGFVQQMPTGHLGAFARKGGARLPIKELLTIGAPIMATQPKVAAIVQKEMGDSLAKNIDSQISRFSA